jgi:hypothetical protein
MPIALEHTRREWERGHRRLEAEARDPRRYESLLRQVDVVTDELRRRIGQTFTLAELADAYLGADDWIRDAVAERAPAPGWPRTLATVQDAAFHLYSRGALDFRP